MIPRRWSFRLSYLYWRVRVRIERALKRFLK